MENNSLEEKYSASQRSLMKTLIDVRCPECFKPYRVNIATIHSEFPDFKCRKCETQFAFKKAEIRGRTVIACKLGPMDFVEGAIGEKVNLTAAAKMALKEEGSQGRAFPSLVRAWQDLLQDYQNVKKHFRFVEKCDDLQALPYALRKYKDLKETLPSDEDSQKIAHDMYKSVLMKSAKAEPSADSTQGLKSLLGRQWDSLEERFTDLKYWLQVNVNWVRVRKVAPWGTTALLGLYGYFLTQNKNVVGLAVAALFLYVGIVYLLKGRLKWEDFF